MSAYSRLPKNLTQNVALVTGGSRGIGRGIALKLASLGANIAINYNANEEAAQKVVSEIQSMGVKAIAIKGDVSKVEDANRIVEETFKTFGRIDVLVNNAGVFLGSPIHLETDSQYEKVMGVNVNGTFFITRAAVPKLTNGGAIINISSIVSKQCMPNLSVYTMSKAAIDGFSRALASELAPRGIRVNAVSPGFTESDMLASGGDALAQMGIEASLFKRLGSPEDIAETVAYLAVPSSGSWITGSNLDASGGAGRSF
ncbi:short-chain dehydrogenase/reductase SDR [Globomyces pollinis-pini]|nr:short-chain dehydrogenase/reductase SDR [Globomyces pollinis-pini]